MRSGRGAARWRGGQEGGGRSRSGPPGRPVCPGWWAPSCPRRRLAPCPSRCACGGAADRVRAGGREQPIPAARDNVLRRSQSPNVPSVLSAATQMTSTVDQSSPRCDRSGWLFECSWLVLTCAGRGGAHLATRSASACSSAARWAAAACPALPLMMSWKRVRYTLMSCLASSPRLQPPQCSLHTPSPHSG